MENDIFWTTVYCRNAPVLRGVLRRYISDSETVDDLLQEVFILAINKQASYGNRGHFDAWLYRIAVNTALMHLRKSRPDMVPVDMVVVPDGEEDGERGDDVRDIIETAGFSGEELLEAIDCLPDHHRMVFNMYVMDHFSHKQIAHELKISAGTSKSHLARARKKIQQYLYLKALNKKEKKHRKAFMLFAFSGNVHFIDQLFKDKLSGYALPGSSDTSFMAEACREHGWSAVNSAPLSQEASVGWLGGKLSYMIVCGVTAVVTASVCWLGFGDGVEEIRSEGHVPQEIVMPDSIAGSGQEQGVEVKSDTVSCKREKHSPVRNKDRDTVSHRGVEGGKQVVVKRRIVRRDTVVIRDTFIMKE